MKTMILGLLATWALLTSTVVAVDGKEYAMHYSDLGTSALCRIRRLCQVNKSTIGWSEYVIDHRRLLTSDGEGLENDFAWPTCDETKWSRVGADVQSIGTNVLIILIREALASNELSVAGNYALLVAMFSPSIEAITELINGLSLVNGNVYGDVRGQALVSEGTTNRVIIDIVNKCIRYYQHQGAKERLKELIPVLYHVRENCIEKYMQTQLDCALVGCYRAMNEYGEEEELRRRSFMKGCFRCYDEYCTNFCATNEVSIATDRKSASVDDVLRQYTYLNGRRINVCWITAVRAGQRVVDIEEAKRCRNVKELMNYLTDETANGVIITLTNYSIGGQSSVVLEVKCPNVGYTCDADSFNRSD